MQSCQFIEVTLCYILPSTPVFFTFICCLFFFFIYFNFFTFISISKFFRFQRLLFAGNPFNSAHHLPLPSPLCCVNSASVSLLQFLSRDFVEYYVIIFLFLLYCYLFGILLKQLDPFVNALSSSISCCTVMRGI